MKRKKLVLITSMMIIATMLSGCGQSQKDNTVANTNNSSIASNSEANETSYPLTIDAFDNDGNTYPQTFNSIPKKVVTNNQSSTELLLELGLKDYLVGTGDLDNKVLDRLQADYESIPVVSEKGQVAKEAIVGTGADFVIGRSASFTDDTYGTIPNLNEMGINTYTQLASKMNTTQSLDNIILDVRNVGKIFNIQDKANSYADSLQERLDTITSKISNINGEPIKVMLMVKYIDGQFGVYGANASLQTEMLKILNAENVAEKGGTLSTENLISLNPDAIVYVHADKNASIDKNAVESLLSNDLIQTVNAIANKNIIEIDYTELMGYGFRTFDCLEKMANGLYPDLF